MLGNSVDTTVGTAPRCFHSPFRRGYRDLSMLQELDRGGRNCFHMQIRVRGQESGEEGEEEEGKEEEEGEGEGLAACWETCGSKHLGRRSDRP